MSGEKIVVEIEQDGERVCQTMLGPGEQRVEVDDGERRVRIVRVE